VQCTQISAEFEVRGHSPPHRECAPPQNVALGYDIGKISAGCLVIIIIIVITVSEQRQVLRHIRAIAAEAKQELMNAFRRELTLQLVAVLRGKSEDDIERLHRKKSTQK